MKLMIRRNCRLLWLVIMAAFLAVIPVTACGVNRDLLGTWSLVDPGGLSLAPGTHFEFRDDRSLIVSPATPEVAFSYTSSPGGDLTITSRRDKVGTQTIKLTYELNGDRLALTDEEGLTLLFQRLRDPDH